LVLLLGISTPVTILLSADELNFAGTWQTYIVKHESVWHKVRSDVPMEYAATVTVNPLTALRMLQDFVQLNPGALSLAATCYHSLRSLPCLLLATTLVGSWPSVSTVRWCHCPEWRYQHCRPVRDSARQGTWN
jgi:hypothetical protein